MAPLRKPKGRGISSSSTRTTPTDDGALPPTPVPPTQKGRSLLEYYGSGPSVGEYVDVEDDDETQPPSEQDIPHLESTSSDLLFTDPEIGCPAPTSDNIPELELRWHDEPPPGVPEHYKLTPGVDPARCDARAARRKYACLGGPTEAERCVREETCCISVSRWTDKKKVTFSTGVPQGEHAANFVSYLGWLVRQPRHIPVLYTRKWSDIPVEKKNEFVRILHDKFEYDAAYDDKILIAAKERFKTYMYNLRCDHYYPNRLTRETRLQGNPKTSDGQGTKYTAEEWAWLLYYWGSAQFQKMAGDGQQARKSEKKLPHYQGRKKTVTTVEELAKGNAGKQPTRMDVFRRVYTRTKEDKTTGKVLPTDEAVTRTTTQLETLIEENEALKAQGLPHKDMDQCFADVLQPDTRGRVRPYGQCSLTPTSLGITKRALKDREISALRTRVQQLEAEVARAEEERANEAARVEAERAQEASRIQALKAERAQEASRIQQLEAELERFRRFRDGGSAS